MSVPLSTELAVWASGASFEEIPEDVVAATKLRILDVIGLCLAGGETPFGRSTVAASVALSPPGPSRVLGTSHRLGMATAAFANGALSQALEYDDTHDESIVHMSSPAVAAGLALSEVHPATGQQLIAAIAIGNEISCRVGSVSPGQFHRLGFHPSGLFAVFGATYLAGKLLGLNADALARAAGISGSFAAGLLECWVDGTQTKFLHPGWSAQSGIVAAVLAREGTTGPARVFEGRWGLFASHLQDPGTPRDFARITSGLGSRWDSRNASFKPFPAAHVLHPYLDAALRLRERHGIDPSTIARVDCPVAAFIVPIVCEPAGEKLAPLSDSHGRVSFQYSLAEALWEGRLARDAYQRRLLEHPGVLALARKVHYQVDPTYPGPGRFKGAVTIALEDGRTFTEVEEFNRGSAANPMTEAELRAKFDENAAGVLSAAARDRLAAEIARLDQLPDARRIVDLVEG